MYLAVCIPEKEIRAQLMALLQLYQSKRTGSILYHFYENEIDLLYKWKNGEYDAVFFSDTRRDGLAKELREQDKRVRLVCVAPADTITKLEEQSLWYCLATPLGAPFLFPLLDRLLSDVQKDDEAGLVIKGRGSVTHLPFSQIEYVEVVRKTLFFHMVDGRTEDVPGSFVEYEANLLHWPDFIKVHRAYIVNLRHIRKLEANSVLTNTGHSVPVSRTLHAQLKRDYLCRLMVPVVDTSQDGPIPSADTECQNPNAYSILLVDDEVDLCRHWASLLVEKGCVVQMADTAESALHLASKRHYDCVVLDVMLGDSSGFDLCDSLQEKTGAPVIFFSSLSDPENQTMGFLSGAVDYITKDTVDELFWTKIQTRIRLARARRAELSNGSLHVDLKQRRVFLHQIEVLLTAVEFDLLCVLLRTPDTIYPPARLYTMVWGTQQWDDGQAIQLHLSQLRRKLEAIYPEHHYIETVWGKGYRFTSER